MFARHVVNQNALFVTCFSQDFRNVACLSYVAEIQISDEHVTFLKTCDKHVTFLKTCDKHVTFLKTCDKHVTKKHFHLSHVCQICEF